MKTLTELLEDLWDQGNCTGLDGWVGPGRGAAEIDDDALDRRRRDVENAMSAITLAGSRVLVEVGEERARQHAKWGQQNHANGTGPETYALAEMDCMTFSELGEAESIELRAVATLATDKNARRGTVTWKDILLEEVFEALAEEDPAKLRTELIQVAAVAAQWIEAIDRANQ